MVEDLINDKTNHRPKGQVKQLLGLFGADKKSSEHGYPAGIKRNDLSSRLVDNVKDPASRKKFEVMQKHSFLIHYGKYCRFGNEELQSPEINDNPDAVDACFVLCQPGRDFQRREDNSRIRGKILRFNAPFVGGLR